ncbi:MAG: HlyC/CorC family transporter [Kineosporiaceae bacterium]|nr:HlyC/CorC family transporter [Kineosporiaceae bacterium]MBK7622473.1 HlyC/CorC family transporter [Kineosporiaceae bacterium]MBK8078387.1 HlyC/CorC family transporter [Kineosporiaceae bacterium]
MSAWLFLGVGVILTLGTAVFVAAEFSLVSLDRPAVERAVAGGDTRANGVLTAMRSLSTQLSGAQVGITITTLIVGYLVEPSLAQLLEPPLVSLGLSEDAAAPVAVGLGLFLATVFSMVVGELLPQNLGISVPLATAKVVAGPQRAFTRAVLPLITLLNGSANRFLRGLGIEPTEELSAGRTPDELAALVRRSAEAGTLDEQTAILLTRSLDFSAHTADDVMTPRVRVVTIERDETAADVIALARRTGLSRFPVEGEGIDDLVGVVHVKSAVAVPRERRTEVSVAALVSEVLRVPETLRLDPLLLTLRQQGMQLAVVEDEYGGTAGIVTLEDVIEEIVGEVSDEHDRARNQVVRRIDGSYLLPGLMRPDEVAESIGLQVPEDPAYETIAGFLMARLGRLPQAGDVVRLPGAELSVERMDRRRVDRVRVVAVPLAIDAVPDAGGERG